MYSLLLVDDEVSILHGLYKNVDWEELGIHKVFKAGFAVDALEIIRKHHIDILISDIRMPEMDGVQLAERVRKNWPYTKIIFLTGYQDFEYAQTAVDLGVFRYLLKPVHYGELKEVVREAVGVLAQALASEARTRDIEDKMLRLRPALRERHIFRWLEWGDTQLLDNEEELREYDIPLKRTSWGFILAVKTDTPVEKLEEVTRVHWTIRDSAQRILCVDLQMLDYSNMKNDSILVFLQDDETEVSISQNRILERLETFQYVTGEALERTLTLFWTDPAPVTQIHLVYRALTGQIERHIALMNSSIIGPQRRLDPQAALELKSLLQQPSLASMISGLHTAQAVQRIAAIFSELERRENHSKVLLMQVYHEITGALVTDSLNRGVLLGAWAGEYMDFFESMSSVRTLEQFRRTCLAVVESYINYVLDRSLTQAGNLIELVQTTVRKDLTKDITVASLAEQFSYHPNYLSRLFKQETKTSLQEFIINERVLAAKRLLACGMKVGAVTGRVGYDSIAHFSRIFKKVTGMTPKEYQLKRGEHTLPVRQ